MTSTRARKKVVKSLRRKKIVQVYYEISQGSKILHFDLLKGRKSELRSADFFVEKTDILSSKTIYESHARFQEILGWNIWDADYYEQEKCITLAFGEHEGYLLIPLPGNSNYRAPTWIREERVAEFYLNYRMEELGSR